jgi:hypothetical protein
MPTSVSTNKTSSLCLSLRPFPSLSFPRHGMTSCRNRHESKLKPSFLASDANRTHLKPQSHAPPTSILRAHTHHSSSMLRFAIATALCGVAIICQITAQRLPGVPLPVSYFGISAGCFDALNTTVACPSFLYDTAVTYVPITICPQCNRQV